MTEQLQRAGNHKGDLISAVLFKVPPFRGKARLVDLLGRTVGSVRGRWAACTPEPGAALQVDLRDRIERLMWGGCWEPHVQKCLKVLLEQGDTFLDIGAHVGYHTVVAASRVGSAGRVFSFEPDPAMFERLARSVEGLPWVHPIRRAVWEKTTTLTFERSAQAGESGWGALTAVRDLGRGEHIPVEGTSVDDWASESRVENLQAMKIDAEGSELFVLKGAQGVLERLRPSVVLEINEVVLRQAGTSAKQVIDHLMKSRYRLFALSPSRLEEVSSGRANFTSEVLALPEERAPELLAGLRQGGFRG